jgi:hypothetical protein
MSAITLGSEASRLLAEAEERMEIRDAEGKVLGVFEPGVSEAQLRTFERLRELGFSGSLSEFLKAEREVQRAIEDPGYARNWKTTEEIMAKLKSLP